MGLIASAKGKAGQITVGERDIAGGERIENHLRGLAATVTPLKCTVNPDACIFKVGEVARGQDMLQLVALGQFPPLKSDDIATFHYIAGHEPFRFGQRVIAADPGRGTLLLHFPLIVRSNERRGARRFALPRRDDVHAIVVTGLGDGVGASGPLHDVSQSGASLRVEKMVLVSSGKELRLARDLLKPGPLSLVKFRLPGGVDVEVEGTLVHTCPEGAGFRAGLRLGALPPAVAAKLKAYLDGKFR